MFLIIQILTEIRQNHEYLQIILYFSCVGVYLLSGYDSSYITEIKGNLSSEIPFDDSLRFDVNFASWSLTGGWKPNFLVFVTKNACSSMKSILGNSWYSLTKAFNLPTTNCPLPKGNYISSGYDTTLFNDNNFSKVK
ncbi:Uncharacterized protein FWK35_00026537 [Aphis craccivora]|uniref:Uncharacterized protein n=1 Tax=Aphis craccivora TaxID=307492 RepID=A0A6G0YKZ0_APHCR|nr:Uncharacterized protein FWK35_00026537 [Aphis craccivora]